MTKKIFTRLRANYGDMLDAAGRASLMGLHMVSGVLVGGVGGYFLDKWLDTSPWLKIICFTLGVAAGFRNVWLDAKLLLKTQEKEDAAKRGGQGN